MAPTNRPRSRSGARPSSTRATVLAAPAAAPLTARRAPFVLLVLALVVGGLVCLLILNTAIAADSFTQRALSQDVDRLQLQEQELQLAVAAAQAPAALARAAVRQGMIPAGAPGFLIVHPDGTTEVVGAATAATRPAPPSGQEPAEPAPADGNTPAEPGGDR